MEKIKIEDLSLTYHDANGSYSALEHIDLSVEAGEFVCIIGPSGCGKSTLLSVLDGLNKPASGAVYIDGKRIEGPGVDRGVVFQHYSLFPWLTTQDNVVFAMKQSGKRGSKRALTEIAKSYLEKVGLEDACTKYPAQLSGGMQQRVAIARALAMDASILLMDEPFGAIDPKNRRELQELVGQLAKENGKTVVFVTHDIDEAILLADRIVYMMPKRIKAEFSVTIPRPRKKETMIQCEEYHTLSRQLMSMFYQKVAEEIGNAEVVI